MDPSRPISSAVAVSVIVWLMTVPVTSNPAMNRREVVVDFVTIRSWRVVSSVDVLATMSAVPCLASTSWFEALT